jgi:hypothetical protein
MHDSTTLDRPLHGNQGDSLMVMRKPCLRTERRLFLDYEDNNNEDTSLLNNDHSALPFVIANHDINPESSVHEDAMSTS